MDSEALQASIRSALDEFRQPPATEMDLPYYLTHTYLRGDLISAGISPDFEAETRWAYLSEDRDETQNRWEELRPYWDHVRSAIYYRYLLQALRGLYNWEGEEADEGGWRSLSDRIRQASRKGPDWALPVVDRMGVKKVLLDSGWWSLDSIPAMHGDSRFAQVVRMDAFIMGEMEFVETLAGGPVHSWRRYVQTLDEAFERAVREGVVGIKSGLAYERSLHYERVSLSDAERIWTRGLSNASSEGRTAFQDAMMHAVCARCAQHHLPFQIHSGIQAGNFNTLANTNPLHLTNLFQTYPDVRFDLFHGGYPFTQEAGIMAKYFPNVYVDGCWLAHIAPGAYFRALDEWIEILPANKIFAWGGDHGIIDHSYASLLLAKDLIAGVLARKVAIGYFSEKVALHVAERIVGQNAWEVYGFE
jgi:predicted TIM-barrel fold metal-dependent hydrolase